MSNIIPFDEKVKLAEAFAKSKLFGMTDANQVLALMAVCEAEGIHPAKAVQEYHVIQGRPALKADAMLARFQNAGGKVEWKEYTDEQVTGVFSHPNGGNLAVTWTIGQATKIGLVKPGSGWQKFPRAMLRSRCISEGIRSVFPGSVTGFYSPDEVENFQTETVKPTVLKDMGSVIPSVVDLSAIPDDIPDMALPMYVPGNDVPYAHYVCKDDWIDGFAEMHAKIHESSKMTPEEKFSKIKAFRDVNEAYTKTFDGNTTAKFLSKLQAIRKEINNG